jgi:addiction module HigA family antidote
MATHNDDWQSRPFQPDWTVLPGEIIRDAMGERGWTETYLALRLGWTVDDLRALLEGKVKITTATAYLLSSVFEISPQFWTNLQAHYDRDSERIAREHNSE